jgi:hypothetical protein
MEDKLFGKDTLIVAIITLITIITWVGFEVYRTYTITEIPLDFESLTTTLDASLETEALHQLNDRIFFDQEELQQIPEPVEEEREENEIQPELENETETLLDEELGGVVPAEGVAPTPNSELE